MKVRVRVFGSLAQYTGGSRLEFELPDGATLADLYGAFGREWGVRLPAQLWNGEIQRFRGRVMILAGGQDLNADAALLPESAEISIVLPLAGG